MKKRKLSKKEQRRKWAGRQAAYLAAHPEQVQKKAQRAKVRRKAAKLIHSAAIGESSQTGKKVSTR